MTVFQAFILGIVQGITEFLPISSSGHLVLVPFLFGWSIPEEQIFPFDVLVQLGTLLAVFVYFYADLIKILKAFLAAFKTRDFFGNEDLRLGWYIVLASIPAGFFGLLFKDYVEKAFQSIVAVALFLFVTAALLLLSEKAGKTDRKLDNMKWLDALWIGIGQVLAIFPGVSRSGATISAGLFRNFTREAAARFSFLMSIPVMLAAGLLSILDLFDMPNLGAFLPVLAIGFVVSAVVGYFSIRFLLKFLQKNTLKSFAFYCAGLGAILLILNYV